MPRLGLVLLAAFLTALIPSPAHADVQTAGCKPGSGTDFNGDGFEDLAIADPNAAVVGLAGAGRVHIRYGGTAGTVTLTADQPAAGAGFGSALSAYDANYDDCDELVVGAPKQPAGSVAAAGAVYMFSGSPGGLGNPYEYQQGSGMPGTLAESGDLFGQAVAGGFTAAGIRYLLVGAPGEDIGTVKGAGAAYYVTDRTQVITQDSSGVAGAVEAGDHFGASVAASPTHFAVGAPDENVEDRIDSGTVNIFGQPASETGAPTPIGLLNQDTPSESGLPEAGDHFGAAVAMTAFTDAGATKSMLAIGVPGEVFSDPVNDDAGRVVTTILSGETAPVEGLSLHQAYTDVEGRVEPGDSFGASLAIVNRAAPGTAPTWQQLLLAVGVPGEDSTGYTDDGAIQIVPLVGAPGDHDVLLDPAAQPGSGWTRASGAHLGRHLAASGTRLYFGDPHGAIPAAYTLPWSTAVGASADPMTTYLPGRDGIPADTVTFGAALA